MTRIIEIIVAATGDSTVQTKGFAGASCREASRFIEDALGTRIEEKLTADFHQPQAAQHDHLKQG